MSLRAYCRLDPRTAVEGELVRDAARTMQSEGVGSLVVVDENHVPVGMVTDRDIALRVLRGGIDPDVATVADVMQSPVTSVTEDARLAVAIRFMSRDGVRRIPVVENKSGALLGLLSSDDVIPLIARELAAASDVVLSQYPADLRGSHALPAGEEG